MAKLTVKDLNVRGKRVFVRVDYNVPMEEKDGQMVVTDLDPAGPVGHVGYAEPAAGYMPFVEDRTRPHWPHAA